MSNKWTSRQVNNTILSNVIFMILFVMHICLCVRVKISMKIQRDLHDVFLMFIRLFSLEHSFSGQTNTMLIFVFAREILC